MELGSESLCYDASCCVITTQKIIFGRGTRLNIEPYQDLKPSFYKLSWENTTACLATGFSRHNKITDLEIFNKTAPAVRIHEESLYNQVAFSNEMDQQCAENNSTSEPCVDLLQPDPKVNFVTLIVLGLRLLFLKTIVFNVLLTLRLWISQ
ncbi:M1-specific T cell receptor alpha chain-like isoform X2 [Sander lucioperca]|uniref:M1-specific T cell receptor alpha chain-like isoform X2 n=1 Tax=Sander lucioperca TaxID=283035 RepID=UPI00125DC30C|nr:M1-specific T cell receptor alpha chain-like isoform X2 [Sander lucioperca]